MTDSAQPSRRKLPRPSGSVTNWSILQAARWIRHQVRAGHYRFSVHALLERVPERNISPDDALDVIARGVAKQWEFGLSRNRTMPAMTMRFEKRFATRVIEVVAAIADNDEIVIVVTVISGKTI